MLFLALKAAISGVLIAIASTLAKRYPGFGALIASLPLVSVLGMMWLWAEKPDAETMAAHAGATFWYVLPSLPMFCSSRPCCGMAWASGRRFWPVAG